MNTEQTLATPEQPIVARGAQYYRNVRYLMSAGAVAMGLWFGYDGYVAWPRENERVKQLDADIIRGADGTRGGEERLKRAQDDRKTVKHHTDFDLRLQRVLAALLPVGGIALLGWTLYNSRGAYQFDGQTLRIPGHPPIDPTIISRIDRARWDRKGIAFVEYPTSDGRVGRARLDDFVYDRGPTDAIYEQLTAIVDPAEQIETSSEEGA